MALTRALYYADMVALKGAGLFAFDGVPFDDLAQSVAAAMMAWGPTVQLKGQAVGTAGAGTINTPTSKVILAPNPPVVIAGLASAGMVGPLSIALGTVVGQALAKTISTSGGYSGAVVGVGIGADVSKVTVADEAKLYNTLLILLGTGPAASMMARGLATGISKLLLTATGAGSVVGSPSTAPATGTSTSVMV